jgi:signal transduction histidine kinase
MLGNNQGGEMKGTGLGLSICKHFITKMGGDVKVESEGIGHGTSFIIQMRVISKLSEEAIVEHKRHAYD